jgi:hypothetical protein
MPVTIAVHLRALFEYAGYEAIQPDRVHPFKPSIDTLNFPSPEVVYVYRDRYAAHPELGQPPSA